MTSDTDGGLGTTVTDKPWLSRHLGGCDLEDAKSPSPLGFSGMQGGPRSPHGPPPQGPGDTINTSRARPATA
jgi:hypothetical protein